MKAKGYALWLTPNEIEHQELSKLIKNIAKKQQTPIFKPHINFLPDLFHPENKIIENARILAATHATFTVTLRNVDHEDFYFRALYIKVDKTTALTNLRVSGEKIFNLATLPPFSPHLSIMYANFPQSKKKEIINEIGEDWTTELTMNTIRLYKIEGEPEDWQQIEAFPLSKK